ncbi:recombinase family protein [Spirulina major]|uniref:recombinase family protein n=1 Tax=Spirulina major TaxID=270636 RepID=UPI0009338E41|nr:recombinase family protein [Spirulina major]
MRIVAYLYSDPLLEPCPDPGMWGVEVDGVYQDCGDRAELTRLLDRCTTDPPQYLLVRRLEEFGNSLAAISHVMACLEAAAVEIIAIQQDYRQGGTTDLMVLLNQIQAHQQSRRIRHGHARNRIHAKPPPGKAPYGYRRGQDRYLIDRSTAPVVKDFFEQFLLFGSLRGAVRYLEKKYGKKIAVTTGRRWLTNPVYRGDITYHNGETVADTHMALLTRDEAAQIDRLLRRNRRLPPRTASAPRSLAGLVVCGACGSRYRVTRTTQRGKQKPDYLYLRPVACGAAAKCGAIAYGTMLQAVITTVCQELPAAVAGINAPQLNSLHQTIAAEITQKQTILAQLPDLETAGILDAETAQLRRYKLQTEIAAARAQLAQLPPENLRAITQTVSLPQFWWDLSEAERRFYLREFIQQVDIQRQEQDWTIQLRFIFGSSAPPQL